MRRKRRKGNCIKRRRRKRRRKRCIRRRRKRKEGEWGEESSTRRIIKLYSVCFIPK